MAPTLELVRAIEREKIEVARRKTLAQKFWAGAELFDYACEITKSGIRMQNPHFDEVQVMAELRRRIELGRRLKGRT